MFVWYLNSSAAHSCYFFFSFDCFWLLSAIAQYFPFCFVLFFWAKCLLWVYFIQFLSDENNNFCQVLRWYCGS